MPGIEVVSGHDARGSRLLGVCKKTSLRSADRMPWLIDGTVTIRAELLLNCLWQAMLKLEIFSHNAQNICWENQFLFSFPLSSQLNYTRPTKGTWAPSLLTGSIFIVNKTFLVAALQIRLWSVFILFSARQLVHKLANILNETPEKSAPVLLYDYWKSLGGVTPVTAVTFGKDNWLLKFLFFHLFLTMLAIHG